MRHYLLGWGQPCVDRKVASGNLAIDHLATNQFFRAGIQAGDTIWVVCCSATSQLDLVGRMVVGSVMGPEGAARRLDASCVATHEIFALPEPGFIDSVEPIDITSLAWELLFDGKCKKLPKKFTSRHLTTVRRLTHPGGDLLWEVWDMSRRQKKTPHTARRMA